MHRTRISKIDILQKTRSKVFNSHFDFFFTFLLGHFLKYVPISMHLYNIADEGKKFRI